MLGIQKEASIGDCTRQMGSMIIDGIRMRLWRWVRTTGHQRRNEPLYTLHLSRRDPSHAIRSTSTNFPIAVRHNAQTGFEPHLGDQSQTATMLQRVEPQSPTVIHRFKPTPSLNLTRSTAGTLVFVLANGISLVSLCIYFQRPKIWYRFWLVYARQSPDHAIFARLS